MKDMLAAALGGVLLVGLAVASAGLLGIFFGIVYVVAEAIIGAAT